MTGNYGANGSLESIYTIRVRIWFQTLINIDFHVLKMLPGSNIYLNHTLKLVKTLRGIAI